MEEGDGGDMDSLHCVDDLAVVLGRLHVIAVQVVGQARVKVRKSKNGGDGVLDVGGWGGEVEDHCVGCALWWGGQRWLWGGVQDLQKANLRS